MGRWVFEDRIESLERSILLAKKLRKGQGMIDLMENTLKLNRCLLVKFN